MATVKLVRSSMKEHICETLLSEITSGRHTVGAPLPTVRQLARRFGTSTSPVHQALEVLEEDGYVVKRQGSGTFIADTSRALSLTDTVALGLGTEGHVWGELELLIARRLSRLSLTPLIFDASTHEGRDRLPGLARSGAAAFVLRGHHGLPFARLQEPPFKDKKLIGIVEWRGPDMPNLTRILSDFAVGGQIVARHLWERGHRNVLVVAPRLNQLRADSSSAFRHGQAFVHEWRHRGGRIDMVASKGWRDTVPLLDEAEILEFFHPAETAPSAVFGVMDVEAWAVRRLLRSAQPTLAEQVEFIGYYNTPWSRAGDPPFSSVDLNLEELASRACEALRQTLRGSGAMEAVDHVRPRLIIR